jgi:hypothetical protein
MSITVLVPNDSLTLRFGDSTPAPPLPCDASALATLAELAAGIEVCSSAPTGLASRPAAVPGGDRRLFRPVAAQAGPRRHTGPA